jgi:PAS domain S-box-containing protein
MNLPGEMKWLEAMPDGVLIVNHDGKIVYANKVCEQLLGWPPADLTGQVVERLVPNRHLNHADLRGGFMAKPSKRSMGAGLKLKAAHRTAGEIPVDIALSPVTIDGAPHVLAVVRDMRAYGPGDLKLRLLSVAVNATPNGVVVTDANGVVEWVNPAACRLTGYSAEELVGNNTRMLKSGLHDEAFYKELWTTLTAGKIWRGVIVNRRKDGSLYHEEQTIAPAHDAPGGITHYIAIKQDVTARIRAEEAMRQAEGHKAMLASVGGICHHLGQPATTIVVSAAMLEHMLADAPSDVKAVIGEMTKACGELQQILNKLLHLNSYRTTTYLESARDKDAPGNQIIEL